MKIFITVIIVLVLLMIGFIAIQNRKPQVKLGVVNGKFYEIQNKPNGVSTQTNYEDKRVQPLPFKESLEISKKAMKEALNKYGNIEIVEETDVYIYGVATTGKMKYHDDLEVYFDEENKMIHYRSASRAGYSDMGLNRMRYDDIVKLYSGK